MVRMALEQHRDCVCIKLDVPNTQSTVSNAAILEMLETKPTHQHMAWSFATSQVAPYFLESKGWVWAEVEAGEAELGGRPDGQGPAGPVDSAVCLSPAKAVLIPLPAVSLQHGRDCGEPGQHVVVNALSKQHAQARAYF